MPTYHAMTVNELNDLIAELLVKLKYANHGLTLPDAVTVAETLGQLRCMIVMSRIHGGINTSELSQWLVTYSPIIDLLQKAEITTNGEEKAVK